MLWRSLFGRLVALQGGAMHQPAGRIRIGVRPVEQTGIVEDHEVTVAPFVAKGEPVLRAPLEQRIEESAAVLTAHAGDVVGRGTDQQ